MKNLRISFILLVFFALLYSGCASLNKTQKGGAVGATAGGAMGAVIGRTSGNTALGAIIGAAVGGATGAIIGHKMDKQAEEISKTVPDVKVERVGEGIVVEFNSNVLFGFDKSNLTSAAKNNLDKLLTVLDTYSDTDIEVQGHTDSKGTKTYNKKLSDRRASAVSDYLNVNGISSRRLITRGYGESEPKYNNSSVDGQTQNRRVEFLITANEKMMAESEKEANN